MAFSDENQNFFRLYYVLMKFGTKALNELLRCKVHQTFPSATTLGQFLALPHVQNELCPARRGYLDPMQKELLYPSGAPSTTVDYGDLDITLVTVLLKNLTVFSWVLYQPCNPAYRTLWTNPTEHDQLFYPIEANVVLLQKKRNFIAHSKKPSLTNEDFKADFDEVKSWVMNIMGLVGSTVFNEDDIEQYRESPLLPEVFQETVAKLLESLEAAEELKNGVRKLMENQVQMEKRLQHQIVRLTSKTRKLTHLLVVSLVFVFVVILGVLAWNRVSADDEFKKGVKSRETLRKELEELKGSLNSKTSSKAAKRKDEIGLARVRLKRETGQDLEVKEQNLRDAIIMLPVNRSLWENKAKLKKCSNQTFAPCFILCQQHQMKPNRCLPHGYLDLTWTDDVRFNIQTAGK